MAGELSFLEKDGVEVANAARTAGYLARGLQPRVSLERRPVCSVLVSELGAGGVAPDLDPAPWFSSSIPESALFLGLLITDLQVGVKAARPSGSRLGGLGGSFVGAEEADGALMQINGMLIARSGAGLAYGREWLASVLGSSPCDPCALSELRYRDACPPGGDQTVGEWILYDAGVTGDGIVPGDADPDASAWQDVSFQLTSQHAARFRAATVSQAAIPLAPFVALDTDEVFDFATNPFTDGRLAVPAGLTSGHSVTGGHVTLPTNGFGEFYRVGPAQRDVTISCAFHTSGDPLHDVVHLVGRWEAPTNATSDRFIAGTLTPGSPLGPGVILEVSEMTRAGFSHTNAVPGLYSASGLLTLSPNTGYWLRFQLSGDFARMQIFDTNPYDSLGNLLDIDPLGETAWPPDVGAGVRAGHDMTDHGVDAAGTWGVAVWQTPATAPASFIDDLAQRAECMDFIRWFCEQPPFAAAQIELSPTRPGGTVAARVTLDATAGQIAGVFVEAYRGACPVIAGATPFARIDVPLLAAGGVLVVDSARRRVVYTDPTGATFDGSALLELAAGRDVEWLEAAGCGAPICLRAGVASWCGTHPDATITIERQERSR